MRRNRPNDGVVLRRTTDDNRVQRTEFVYRRILPSDLGNPDNDFPAALRRGLNELLDAQPSDQVISVNNNKNKTIFLMAVFLMVLFINIFFSSLWFEF